VQRKSLAFFLILAVGSLLPLPAQARVSVWTQRLNRPVAILPLRDGRILVVEERGTTFQHSAQGERRVEPWLNLWPSQAGNRVLSAVLTHDLPNDIRVVFYVHIKGTELQTDYAQLLLYQEVVLEGQVKVELRQILADGLPAASTRMGGGMAVGSDGALYLGTGSVENNDLPQNDESFAGKVLRIPLSTDVPLVWGKPEIWAKGFHNVVGLAFFPSSNNLYAADMGPRPPLARNWDEINFVQKDQNYGFPIVFGGRASPPYRAPLVHSTGVRLWDPGGLVSVGTGPWNNSLVWTGIESQALFRITLNRNEPEKVLFFEELFTRVYGKLKALAVLPNGQLLMGTYNSEVGGEAVDRILLIQPR